MKKQLSVALAASSLLLLVACNASVSGDADIDGMMDDSSSSSVEAMMDSSSSSVEGMMDASSSSSVEGMDASSSSVEAGVSVSVMAE